MKAALFFSFGVLLAAVAHAQQYGFTNFVGQPGVSGFADGTGTAARFVGPHSLKLDDTGNLYVADLYAQAIRKVTPAGEVSTVINFHDYIPMMSKWVADVAVDNSGRLFATDGADNAIIWQFTPNGTNWDVRWMPPESGFSGWVDGPVAEARFKNPTGLALDAAGNLYVADWGNNAIRKLTPQGTNWVVSTLAGNPTAGYADGVGTNALFNGPEYLAVDGAGNVFVADSLNNAIRKITPAGLVTTLAGGPHAGRADGVGTNAQFEAPHGLAVDSFGNVFIADSYNSTIRKITPQGEVTTVAGLAGQFTHAEGVGSDARFNQPYGIAVDSVGDLYVAEYMGFNISKGVPAQELQIHNTGGGIQLDVTGPIGSSYAVEYTDALSGTASWQALTTLTLTNTVQSVTDSSVPSPTQRIYRTVQSQ